MKVDLRGGERRHLRKEQLVPAFEYRGAGLLVDACSVQQYGPRPQRQYRRIKMRGAIRIGHVNPVVGTQHTGQPRSCLTLPGARYKEQNVVPDPDDIGRVKDDLILVEVVKFLKQAMTQALMQRFLGRLQFAR